MVFVLPPLTLYLVPVLVLLPFSAGYFAVGLSQVLSGPVIFMICRPLWRKTFKDQEAKEELAIHPLDRYVATRFHFALSVAVIVVIMLLGFLG